MYRWSLKDVSPFRFDRRISKGRGLLFYRPVQNAVATTRVFHNGAGSVTTIRPGEPTSIAHDSWIGYSNCMPFSIPSPSKGGRIGWG
jgi:hypothetical protein